MNIRKRWKAAVSIVVVGVLFLYVLAYFLVQRSDAFEAAATFLRSDPEVARLIGGVQEVSLSWAGWELETSGMSGSARFAINLVGATASSAAYVELQKRGIWEVSFARIMPDPGVPIVLKEMESRNAL